MTSLTGHSLGYYHLLAELGGGGMATVYRAYDTRTGRLVALKLLLPHLWHDREFVERFRREARNAAALRHPNIVPVYESGIVEGYPYLAMAYVEGGSLAERLLWQRGPLPLDRAADVLTQVAAALDYAHAQGLVHRDVKPSNVLLARDGQALLTDFGIAKAAWDSKLTQTGTRVGTPAYMAPEQARGQAVGPWTDVYALGVVLYEMVTGRPPFQGNTDAVLYQHVHEPPPPPRRLNPALPPVAERVILRALAKDPARRYRTAGELAAAFQRAVEPVTRVAQPVPVTPQTPGAGRVRPVTPTRRPLSSRQIVTLAGIAGATLIALVLALSSMAHWLQPVLPPTVTPSPGITPTSAATPSPMRTVTLTPAPPPQPTGTPTPTLTPLPTSSPRHPTATPVLTPIPQAIPPELVAPAQGHECRGRGPVTFQWRGSLSAGQAYQVTAYHVESGYAVQSGLVTDQNWIANLPAERYGEWRWTVSVVQGERTVATSSEWMFWFNPFPGGGQPPSTRPPPTPEKER